MDIFCEPIRHSALQNDGNLTYFCHCHWELEGTFLDIEKVHREDVSSVMKLCNRMTIWDKKHLAVCLEFWIKVELQHRLSFFKFWVKCGWVPSRYCCWFCTGEIYHHFLFWTTTQPRHEMRGSCIKKDTVIKKGHNRGFTHFPLCKNE